MRRRWRWLLLGAVLLVLVGLVVVRVSLQIPRPKASVTQANYDRLGAGMTEMEVVKLLAGPYDRVRWDREAGTFSLAEEPWSLLADRGGEELLWYGDGMSIWVSFDGAGRLRDKAIIPEPVSFFDRLRRLLPW
jgi:hypothetical protein